ncbi:MAG TPA: SIS domain-containing protein [Pelolinea sp.]|nr:SIS domain-containing protein [Pelolinea sp.]
MSAELYIDEVKKLIEKIEITQMDNIHHVAELISNAIIAEKLVYIFGAGHSNILAIECFDRAGGLGNMQPIFDSGLDYFSGARRQGGFERLPGYVGCIINDYDIKNDDVVIIISNSGRNPAPVQMALEVKKRGAVVVAITSLEHSNAVTSNDPSGMKLIEIADIVIDNGCPSGDAMIKLPNFPPKVGPGSTVAGATILNAIITQAAKKVLESGIHPPVGFSGNLPEAQEYNKNASIQQQIFTQKMRHK